MGRRPNPQRKQDLLDEIVEYVGEHGIGDLSLRPLAKRLGTSTYTLTYQFGSKDQLLTDAVRHGLSVQRQALARLLDEGHADRPSALVYAMWEWGSQPQNLRLVRMLLEAATLAQSQPTVFGDVGQQIVNEGVSLLQGSLERAGVPPGRSVGLATQGFASLAGLQLDLIATGDRSRLAAAVDELCAYLDERVRAVSAAPLSEVATA